jgi:hypothetical protein
MHTRLRTVRVLFYSNYLLEDLTGSTHTIAPGCQIPLGARCNFEQFLSYILKVDSDTQRPQIDIFESAPRHERQAPWEFSVNKPKRLVDQLNSFRSETGMKFTGSIDLQRLLPGSADYAECLRRFGNSVGNAASWLEQSQAQKVKDDEADKKAKAAKDAGSGDQEDAAEKKARNERIARYAEVQKLVDMGKKAVTATYELRLLDQEGKGSNRLAKLQELLNVDVIERGTDARGPNVANDKIPGPYKTFNAAKTIALGVTQQQIDNAITAWKGPVGGEYVYSIAPLS